MAVLEALTAIRAVGRHGGASHSEAEAIDPESALNGAKVPADTLWELSDA